MSHPTPLQSLLGGLSLPVPVHALMLLNGNVFGISGFMHRAIKGNVEGFAGVAGLILGGMLVGYIDGKPPAALALPLSQIVLSGFLVGLGTKMGNGCTSGHMLCGISRLSVRSLVATASFFTTGAITANLLHANLPAVGSFDWTLGAHGASYLALQAIPFAVSLLIYTLHPHPAEVEAPSSGAVQGKTKASSRTNSTEGTALLQEPSRSPSPCEPCQPCQSSSSSSSVQTQPLFRALGFLSTSLQFALALQLSQLTDPVRVVSFLLLPLHRAFDPSLAFLALGAMPLGFLMYRYARGCEKPRVGGKWAIPKAGRVDWKLVVGAAVFGVGWGMAGVCPGPGLVNLGRSIVGGANVSQIAAWLAAVSVGGLLA